MMTAFKGIRVATLAAGLAALLATVGAAPVDAAVQKSPRGTIILMRGLANVFSLGLDDLNNQLHAKGVTNSVVTSYADWTDIANHIVAAYRQDRGHTAPVILMGHSFGADATLEIAGVLADKGVPVALIVNFDAVSETEVPRNVAHVVNFYESHDNGLALKPGEGFKGKLENIDVVKLDPEIGHLNIEKSQRLHTRAIAEVLKLLRRAS
jgi:thioesterase domain-containing protein